MSEQVGLQPSVEAFEYVLCEGDSDDTRTVISSQNQISPWIDPEAIKLRHRVGRGPFGDVWIATLHQTGEDHKGYHEVAVKMLNPIKEDCMQAFMLRFENVLSVCQGLPNVCLLHGITIKGEKACIVMKFYEGSLGDKIGQLKGGKVSVPDLLRYGIELAQGVLELHSRGLLVLNLKPSNILLDENDQVVLGDIGLPMLLLGIPWSNPDVTSRLGTPNYMAPEQWEPNVRGPVSFETDSWGFACSILEMLSGVKPWSGKSNDEIYHLVVTNQERPNIPSGLPPAVENVISGCFEYDLRNRPLIRDILQTFKSPNAIYGDSGWIHLGGGEAAFRSTGSPYSNWFVGKDALQVGDMVRSRKSTNSSKQESMNIPEGTVVGMDSDAEGVVLVRVHGIHDPLKLHSSTLERVSSGFSVGDWVRLHAEGKKKHSSIGILHSIDRNGQVSVAFIGMERLWLGNASELQMAETFYIGQFVRLKANLTSPRFEWPCKRRGGWETGRVSRILSNGCLLVRFPGRLFPRKTANFMADPAEIEAVSFDNCVGFVNKYRHLEDFHWAVRPVVIALGLFTALKLGLFVGRGFRRPRKKERSQGDQDTQTGANSAWLPPPVANILFRDGVGIPK